MISNRELVEDLVTFPNGTKYRGVVDQLKTIYIRYVCGDSLKISFKEDAVAEDILTRRSEDWCHN